MQNCSLHLVALTATYRRSLNSPLPSIINAWLNGQLAVSTSWSLGKEKSSRINAHIFPDPMGSSNFPCGHSKRAHLKVCSFAGDPYGTRTHVTTVKGWCLNRLTNGPLIFTMLVYHLLQILSMNFLSLSQNISKYLQKISFSSSIMPLFDTVFRIQRVPAPSVLQNRKLRVKT